MWVGDLLAVRGYKVVVDLRVVGAGCVVVHLMVRPPGHPSSRNAGTRGRSLAPLVRRR